MKDKFRGAYLKYGYTALESCSGVGWMHVILDATPSVDLAAEGKVTAQAVKRRLLNNISTNKCVIRKAMRVVLLSSARNLSGF